MIRVLETGDLRGASLRQQAEAHQRQELADRLVVERVRKRQARRFARWQRRTERADRIGFAALCGRDEWDYVDAGLYLAADDHGHVCGPRADRSGWYDGFCWWRPLHLLAWVRTAVTGRAIWVEGS